VDRDVLVGVDRLEVQQLGDDQVGDLVIDGGAQEDDAIVEQPGVDVVLALSAGAALDDGRYKGHRLEPSGPAFGARPRRH